MSERPDREASGPKPSDEEAPATTAARFREGLELDRLHTPEIRAFLGGLPRRARVILARDIEDAEVRVRQADLVTNMVDRLNALIEALHGAGYPPDHRLEPVMVEPLEPSVDDEVDLVEPFARLDAAATESLRYLAGIPLGAWEQNRQLLDVVRTAVGDLAGDLREIAHAGGHEDGGSGDWHDNP